MSHRLGVLAAVAAAAMAVARVCMGARYPLNVVAGLILGALVSLTGYLLLRPALRRLLTKVAATPMRILLSPAGTTPVDVRNESR